MRGSSTTAFLEPGDLLRVYNRVQYNAEQSAQYHVVLINFLCRRVPADVAAGSDSGKVRWFTREQLPGLEPGGGYA